MEGLDYAEEGVTEEKYSTRLRAEEVITDDIPTQESLDPFPVKLVKVSTGKEVRYADERDTSIKDASAIKSEIPDIEGEMETIKVECCSSGNEEASSPIPGVDVDKIKVESWDSQIVEHTVKIEHIDCKDYEDTSPEFTAHRQPEQNPYNTLTHPVDITAEVVTIQKVNVNTLQDSRDVLRFADLKRNYDESTASTSRGSMKTFCYSSMDGKATVTPARIISDGELGVVMKTMDDPLKQSGEKRTEYQEINKFVRSESSEDIATFRCNFCIKAFKQKESLARHINLHRAGRRSKCIRSNNCFNDCGKRKEEIRNCRFCEKYFNKKWDLIRHERTHTKEKPYICHYCEKVFSQSCNLLKHQRIHTKEKPYKCSYCEKCFSQSSSLTRHERIHTKEKPYKCNYCEKSCTDNSDLVKHVRTHTKEKPYKCTYCEKCCTNNSDLRIHMRIHTNEKPYKCSYCERCFRSKTDQRIHLRIHTKEKPYKCHHCGKCFNRSGTLVAHLRIHEREKV